MKYNLYSKYIKKPVIILSLLTIIFSTTSWNPEPIDDLKGNITISGAFALYPLVIKWAEEFKKLHPNVKIDISAGGAGKGITDALTGVAEIGMVSRDINPEEFKKGAFAIAVTKDAVVPIISQKNPLLNELLKKGIKKSGLSDLYVTGKARNWGQATGIKSGAPIHVYTRSDAAGAAETWAKFLGIKQEDLQGVGVYGDPGVAASVLKDPVGIGYNNIGFAYDPKTKRAIAGIQILPIDLNNNGVIDPDENFYTTSEQIIDAIQKGKYPSPPARDLYFVTKGKPVKKEVAAFIKFALTDGQKFVHEAGFINLANDRLQTELKKLQ